MLQFHCLFVFFLNQNENNLKVEFYSHNNTGSSVPDPFWLEPRTKVLFIWIECGTRQLNLIITVHADCSCSSMEDKKQNKTIQGPLIRLPTMKRKKRNHCAVKQKKRKTTKCTQKTIWNHLFWRFFSPPPKFNLQVVNAFKICSYLVKCIHISNVWFGFQSKKREKTGGRKVEISDKNCCTETQKVTSDFWLLQHRVVDVPPP